MGIPDLSLHLRNSAILQTTKLIAELRNCDYGPSKFHFCNSATLCSLLSVPLLSSPFSSAQDDFKIIKNIFGTVCFSGNQKLALKGQLHEIFNLQFFFINQQDSLAKNILKIEEGKLSSLGLKLQTRF